jgi:hypothetical protein
VDKETALVKSALNPKRSTRWVFFLCSRVFHAAHSAPSRLLEATFGYSFLCQADGAV